MRHFKDFVPNTIPGMACALMLVQYTVAPQEATTHESPHHDCRPSLESGLPADSITCTKAGLTDMGTAAALLSVFLVAAALSGILLRKIKRSALQRNLVSVSLTNKAPADERTMLRTLIDNLPDRIYIKDAEGRFMMNNIAHMHALGASSLEILTGKTDFDFRPRDIAQSSRDDEDIILQTGLPLYNREERTILSTGERGWILTTKVPLTDADGKAIGIIGISRDITKRKRAEEALKTSEAKFRSLFENVRDGVYQSTPEGRFLTVNPAFVRMFGYESEDAVLQTSIDKDLYADPADRERFRDVLREQGEVRGLEVRLKKKNGDEIIVLENAYAVRGENDALLYFEGTVTDITSRKQAEERLKRQAELLKMQAGELINAREAALEASRLKSEFVANMSHEIRTPMNGIIGMTSLLIETNLTPEQREYTEIVRQSGEALLTVVNDILDFSKIEAGKLTMEILDFDLITVVEGTIDLFAPRAQEKGLELVSLIEGDVLRSIRGDPGRVRQVLSNLVGNAIKFTQTGEITVSVHVLEETDQCVKARCEVTDTGIGLSDQERVRLFQPFTQADGSTTRKFGGTGLGLAISKQLVQMMGGTIGVDSQRGKGSTFWWEAQFDKQPEGQRQIPSRTNLSGLRCLIVDDNKANRDIVHHYVTSWGLLNGSAESGRHAMEMLRAATMEGTPYDLAILDMQMPEMDGLQLARLIKGDPDLSALRLILLTSMGNRKTDELKESGFSAGLVKPIRQSQLFDCIATVMASSSSAVPQAAGVTQECSDGVASELPGTVHLRSRFENGPRILVVEDNAVNQKVAARMLEKLGYRTDVAGNGIEALEAMARTHYEIVFMDCHMPEMDGFEATARIRETEGGNGHTTIVAMTANALRGDKEECLAAGMDDYIAKPVKQADLQAAIDRVTKNAKNHRTH